MKLFVTVEQGHCCLGAEATHTPMIHARLDHRMCSPAAFAAAATTKPSGFQYCSVLQEWYPTCISRRERLWQRRKEKFLFLEIAKEFDQREVL